MDHAKLVEMYYSRNINMNINNNGTIIKAMKKLGYNIDNEIIKKQKNNDETRSNILSKFLNDDDTLNFYNSLTIEELEYLGY